MTAMQANSMRRAGSLLTLLGGMAALLFLADPAQAQVCEADLEDLAEDVLELYIDELNSVWGVDLENEEFCTKVANNFFKACQSAAIDNIKCLQNQT